MPPTPSNRAAQVVAQARQAAAQAAPNAPAAQTQPEPEIGAQHGTQEAEGPDRGSLFSILAESVVQSVYDALRASLRLSAEEGRAILDKINVD